MDPKNLEGLRPSARNKLLGQECHKSPDAARKVAARLNAQDVGVVLVHSLSFEAIIPALHHEYPITRNLAAKAFQKAWLTLPASQVAQAVGGAEGLADILNTVPFQDAKNLATKLGHHYRGAEDPRTQILDSLVYLLNPFLNQESGQKTHPISRLGSTLTFPLLPALSPNTVWQLIPSVRPQDKHRLRVLLQNQPTVIAELLSIEREKYNNTNLRFNSRELNMLFTMPSVRGVKQEPECHWGLELFLELLEKTNHSSKLIFQPPLAELVNYTALLLRHAPNEKQWLNLLDRLLSRAEANKQSHRLPLLIFIPIIRAVARKLAKCEEGNARLDAAALEGVIKRIGGVASGVNTATSAPMLPTIAPSTRAKVLRLLNNMTEQDDWKFPEDLPQLTLSTVATLGPSHGEPLLRKLTSYFDKTSFQGNGLSFTEYLGTLKRLVNLAPADTQDMITAAVRGRWAFFSKDKEGQQETRKAIERWKKLIHKQRKPEGRVDYTNALILVTVIIEDVQLMEEAAIWSLERFLKDQDVRPALINQIKGSCTPVIAGLLQDFEENAKHGDIILSAFIDTIDKARKEPGFNSGDSDTCYLFIYDVLKSRMHLAQNHRLPVEIIERAISPLAELFLRVEKMCLNDPGTFTLFPNYPTTYGWYQIGRSVSSGRSGSLSKAINLSTPYRRVVTRFMDKLAAQREALFKERRESLELLGRDLEDWDQRYPWPYHVDGDFLKDFPWEEDAPVLLEYLNKVIYTNLTKDQVDEKDITSGSWYSALTLLADSLKKDPKRSTKFLLPIIDHHRTKAVSESGDVTDISAHLMYSDSFMRAVWKNEALLEAFYAPYLSRKEEGNRLELFFGAPEPTDESYQEDSRFKLLTQRQGGPYSLDNMSKGILPKFKVKGSHHLRRHLTIVAVVLWFYAAKAKPPEQYEFMAVDNAPLDFSVIYSSTKIPISNRRQSGRREVSVVARSIFLLSEPEIKNIISSLKQLLPGEDDQPHLDRALQQLVSKALPRSHVPRALEENMFTILSNPEKSSIHRHFLPYTLLKAISPENSVQLTSHFVKLILEAVQEARETKGAEADSGPKVTTIKQVVSTVAQPVTGFAISQMAEELSRLARMNNHPSIQEDLIRNLVRLLQNEAKVQVTSQLNLLWKTLQRLAIIAGSLNETRALSEKDWEKDELPKIVVDNQRPAQLMAVNLSTLSVEDRCHWAQILEEMLSQQVLSTKRWLSELLRRHEKMDQILETIPFGPPLNAPLMNVATSYTNLFKCLPKDSWHLRILQRQIVSYVPADQLQVECASFSNSDFIWTATDEGKAFAALMANWRSKSMDSFTTIVSLLQRYGSPELSQALKDAIDLLLQPTAMFISATDVNRRSPPWEHLRQLAWKLMPAGNMNEESREHWIQRVRPIIEWMAPVAQAACQKDERNRLLYLPLLNQIEFMLLPFPSIMMGNTAQKDFAHTLLDLGAKIQDQPVALLTLPEFTSDMLLRATRLTPNTTSTALHLMKEADQRTNKKESLLGHRLALEAIEKSYYSASRTDQEKATSLIWELEQHIDEGVRAIALSYARTIKRA